MSGPSRTAPAPRAALRLLPALVALALGACAGQGPVRPGDASGAGPGVASDGGADALAPIGEARLGRLVALPAGNELGVAEVRVIEAYRSAGGRDCRRVALPPRGLETRVVCRRADGRWSATRALVHSGLARSAGPRRARAASAPTRAPSPLPAVAVATPTRGPRFERGAVARPFGGAAGAIEPVGSSRSGGATDAAARTGTPGPRRARARGGADDVMLPGGAVRTCLAAGETLWDVAARLLGSGHRWPIIAETNGVEDPTRMEVGTVLLVPARSPVAP